MSLLLAESSRNSRISAGKHKIFEIRRCPLKILSSFVFHIAQEIICLISRLSESVDTCHFRALKENNKYGFFNREKMG